MLGCDLFSSFRSDRHPPPSSFWNRVQPEVKLKLSGAETYSKMRLKLVPNYNYDSHSDASAQRDNMGV